MSTSVINIVERLSKDMGDWRPIKVTTAQGATVNIVSTDLAQYDDAQDHTFQNKWVYIADFLNEGIERKVQYSYTGNSSLDVYGANLTADASNLSNVWISTYRYSDKKDAIVDSIRDLYPIIHQKLEDKTSITTNSVLYEYDIPANYEPGYITALSINYSGIGGDGWMSVGYSIVNEGRSIRFDQLWATGHQVKIEGVAPINTYLPYASNVINIGTPQVELLTAKAKVKMYERYSQPASAEDVSRYERQMLKAEMDLRKKINSGRMFTDTKLRI